MSLFIRSQVEPEIKENETSPCDQYGHVATYHAYAPGFSGMPVPIGYDYPPVECVDTGRVMLIGA